MYAALALGPIAFFAFALLLGGAGGLLVTFPYRRVERRSRARWRVVAAAEGSPYRGGGGPAREIVSRAPFAVRAAAMTSFLVGWGLLAWNVGLAVADAPLVVGVARAAVVLVTLAGAFSAQLLGRRLLSRHPSLARRALWLTAPVIGAAAAVFLSTLHRDCAWSDSAMVPFALLLVALALGHVLLVVVAASRYRAAYGAPHASHSASS